MDPVFFEVVPGTLAQRAQHTVVAKQIQPAFDADMWCKR